MSEKVVNPLHTFAVCFHNKGTRSNGTEFFCQKDCPCGSPCRYHAYFDPKGLCVENMSKKLERLMKLLQEHRHVQNTFAVFTSKAQVPYEVPGSIAMIEDKESIKWDENA